MAACLSQDGGWADFDDIFGVLETNPKNPPFNTFGANS
jgi:hypothetical protein